ncbi:Panacea domain-containing protein [Pararhodospirillum oryzae]|uniref:Uncharacterized protein n=1 Tax=Pararhodospirillum oryzae TaxID=478448 RepID=A0A512H416_9PROT|nr:type II toxin-antitoxin system antitoxin SocA domain-containing protein [Pararhodospirillum oryzae]GEO80148.1 hypothetical protein ROR02_02790 [Pararhodospirillum oryzae]
MTSTRPPLVDSTFDVANWFLDRALNDGEYLQPQKLHRLMFLAQAYCAVAHNGRRLMPAVFIADAMGPLEPNVYRAFENERPWISEVKMSEAAKQVLDSIWRRFGVHSAEHLSRVVRRHPPFAEAWASEPRSVITEEAMVAFYGQIRPDRPPVLRPDPTAEGVDHTVEAPALETVLRPRVMRSHKGRPVNVMPWVPKGRKDDGGT